MKPIPLNQIINKNNLDRTMVTTLDIEEIKEDDGITYDFTPASLYCYTVSRNVVDSRLNLSIYHE